MLNLVEGDKAVVESMDHAFEVHLFGEIWNKECRHKRTSSSATRADYMT
ncbi:hypothetical protein [Listeria grandensis]|nr:hypothetical protein [Listeria grandensis]